MRDTFLGVPRIMIKIFWGAYSGPFILGNHLLKALKEPTQLTPNAEANLSPNPKASAPKPEPRGCGFRV